MTEATVLTAATPATTELVAVGKLERVELRELWLREGQGFSAWLEGNLGVLGEHIGRSFSALQREKAVGDFSLDLLAEDEAGGLVIIENQLERTDHDHLGKVITYLTNLEAKTAVWIAKEARPEHIRAVQWLNESTASDLTFYLVKLAAYRIGASPPAPLFTVIVGPSVESKAFGDQKKELAERHVLRRRFWEQLLARAKARGVQTHAGRSPGIESWIGAGAGRSGFQYIYLVWMEEGGAVELYIDVGDGDQNKSIFDRLVQKRLEVESVFGAPLEWERLEDRRASRIRYLVKHGGLTAPEEQWVELQDRMVDAMDRLVRAVGPELKALK